MENESPKPRKRWKRVAWIVLGLIVLFVACLPTIAAKTSLRNTVVNHALDDPRLTATVDSASFGWLSSTSLDQLKVQRDDDRLLVTIDRVFLERSLLGLLLARPDIGGIEIDRPHLEFTMRAGQEELPLDDLAAAIKKKDRPETTFNAEVRRADIVLRAADVPEPVVDVDEVTLTLRLRQSGGGSGREFVIDPAVVLDHQELTPELCDRGLHLVAPVLAETASVEGEVSVEIEEFLLPVDDPKGAAGAEDRLKIVGNVALHDVRSNLKNPILIQTTKLVAGLLEKSPPETIRVLENSRIHFHVADEGVYHEGLAFVLPDISDELVIRTSGFVGVDRRLDLVIEATIPSQLTAGIPVVETFSQRPLKLAVHGTIDKPKVGFADGQDVLDELAARLENGEKPAPAKPLATSIIELVGGLASQKEDQGVKQIDVESTAKDIINVIRSSRKAKKKDKQEKQKPDK